MIPGPPKAGELAAQKLRAASKPLVPCTIQSLPACIELAFWHRHMGSFGFDSGGDEKVEAEREFIFSFLHQLVAKRWSLISSFSSVFFSLLVHMHVLMQC